MTVTDQWPRAGETATRTLGSCFVVFVSPGTTIDFISEDGNFSCTFDNYIFQFLQIFGQFLM